MPSKVDPLVMIQTNRSVPRIPDSTLHSVFGERTIRDTRVERTALNIEYWIRGAGSSPNLVLKHVLEILKTHGINETNISDLISLLAKRKLADKFFDLAQPRVDREGRLRDFLMDNNINPEAIYFYGSYDGLSPKAFVDGFFFGVGESFASIILSLPEMAKSFAYLNQQYYLSILKLALDPGNEVRAYGAFIIAIVPKILKTLNPAALPLLVLQLILRNWIIPFATHLNNHESFEAGRVLGKIGGDLWQLVTGLAALGRLLKIGQNEASRFLPVFFSSIRGGPPAIAESIKHIAALLSAIGKDALRQVPIVGMKYLRKIVPTRMWNLLFKEGVCAVAASETTVQLVPPHIGLTSALEGSGLSPTAMKALVTQEGKPQFIAVVSDGLPEGISTTDSEGGFFKGLDIDKVLEDLVKVPEEKSGAIGRKIAESPEKVQRESTIMLTRRFEAQFDEMVQKVSRELTKKILITSKTVTASKFGMEVEKAVVPQIEAFIRKNAPRLRMFNNRATSTVAEEMMLLDEGMKARKDAIKKLMDTTVAKFLFERKDLLEAMEGKQALDWTEQQIEKYISRFGHSAGTKVGRMRSDALVIGVEPGSAINVDFTSMTNLKAFDEEYRRVYSNVPSVQAVIEGKATWADMEKAIKDAKASISKDQLERLRNLAAHAERETVLRHAILVELLGNRYRVTTREIKYENMKKLATLLKDQIK